jgi:large subunit ribosomal protein L10
MPTQKKIDSVAELKDRIEQSTLIAGTEYRGLRVKEMHELRRALRQGGIELKVVKNSLLKRAAEDAGQPDLMQIIEGPVALAFSSGDVIEASRALTTYLATAPQGFAVRGGYMDGTVLTLNDLRDLVRIPPRPVLIATILGQLQSPLAGLVGLLDAPLQELSGLMNSLLSELPGLVEARARQLEAEG